MRVARPLALLALALVTASTLALATALASTSSPLWYPRIVGDKDDEWSKAALLTVEGEHLALYVVGNKWRQPLVMKFDVTSDRVSWAVAIGNRSKGDLGDWPEFRDVAACGGKVFAVGFGGKSSTRVLVASIDASSGKVLWVMSYGSSSGEVKGLGITVDPSCKHIYVVGYAKGALGANVRDAVVLEIDAASGKLLKAVRVDLGGSDYFVDAVYANSTLYAVGMSDALDTPGKYYDIIVAKLDPATLKPIEIVDIGNRGVYEVAAISNYKNSGGALAFDGRTLYVLGQMKSVKKGKTSTLVLALDPKSLGVEWSVRIYNASDIDVEFYPDQIAVGGKLLYIAGHSWFYPGLWKEGGFIAILDKGSGAPVAFYIVHDSQLRSGMGLHGISVATVGGVDYVAAVSDYYLSTLRIAIEDKLSQVTVAKYGVKELDATAKAKVVDVTKDVACSEVHTEIDKVSMSSPSNGKSNYLLLFFAEPAKAVSTTKTITKTLTSTQTLTLTRTVVVTATVTTTTTALSTTTVSKTITKTVPTTVTSYRTSTVTTTTVKSVTVPTTTTKTVTTTTTVVSTSTVAKSVVPGWVWGVVAALFFIGLGIGIAVGRVVRK